MTGCLQAACQKGETAKRYPRMPDRLLLERAVERMAEQRAGRGRDPEAWSDFIDRVSNQPADSLRPRDLKRWISESWEGDDQQAWAGELLDQCVKRNRKSLDRTIIHSYLAGFPTDHPAFDHLTAASAFAAQRHEWPWRERGERWRLWDAVQGPKYLAQALLSSEEPARTLRDAGLDGDLGSGGFVENALVAACEIVSAQRGPAAEAGGARLAGLFDTLAGAVNLNATLAFALLGPWITENCSKEHRRLVSALLVRRIGDPRLQHARWSALSADVRRWQPKADVDAAFSVLRRWLVQATVREFFAVVAKTTDRPDQWKERTEFWLGYLDAGAITDAWFAFGSMAERQAKKLIQDESVGYAGIAGTGADPSHSALVFTLGDLRIAEWSHNGRTRFWRVTDHRAPPLYQKVYYAMVLRAMHGGVGFDAISHTSNWQWKFAKHVHKETGIRHPKFGSGW